MCACVCVSLPLFTHSPVPDASDIAWSTPGNPRSTLSQNNAILTVRTVTVGDGGVYTCQVNELGNYSATLTVLGKTAHPLTPTPCKYVHVHVCIHIIVSCMCSLTCIT